MEIRIDARGKQCPLPMIEAKNAINRMQEAGIAEVLADNEIAVQNIVKMAEHKGFRTSSSKISENEYRVQIFVESETKESKAETETAEQLKNKNQSKTVGQSKSVEQPETGPQSANRERAETGQPDSEGVKRVSESLNTGGENGKTVVVLASDVMGEGDKKLGKILMKGFIYALTQLEKLPDTIIMYNSGAYLSIKDSESAEDFGLLEREGVEILTCGTCLNHYGLTEKLAVGSITDMYTITERLSEAGKIIRP